MRDELSERVFFLLESSKVHFHEKPTDGWQGVIDHFPSATTDIEEASKCYALNRGTACVFHLMRSLEPALAVIARELSVKKGSPTWNAYLTAFRAAYLAKFPAKTASDKEAVSFYSGLE